MYRDRNPYFTLRLHGQLSRSRLPSQNCLHAIALGRDRNPDNLTPCKRGLSLEVQASRACIQKEKSITNSLVKHL